MVASPWPPRTLFLSQTVATIIGAIVQVAVLYLILAAALDQPNHFACPSSNIFFTASIVWALAVYLVLVNFTTRSCRVSWLVLSPKSPSLAKRYSHSLFKYVNTVFFTGIGAAPPATGMWALVGFVVRSAAMDSSVAICGIFIFALQFKPVNIGGADGWWGNNLFINTLNYNYVALPHRLVFNDAPKIL